MNARDDNISEEEINTMIKDIRNFLVNRENYETNQQYLEFEVLFRSYIIKAWFGSNFSSSKYREYNKILARLSIRFYNRCWKQINEINNNAAK